jgi:hypothetical protein
MLSKELLFMRRPAPENENKEAKFKRLAKSRVNNVLKGLDLISNLSNKSNYSYTEEDVSKILRALKDGLTSVEESFSKTKKRMDFDL